VDVRNGSAKVTVDFTGGRARNDNSQRSPLRDTILGEPGKKAKFQQRTSRWPRRLRHISETVREMKMWIRISVNKKNIEEHFQVQQKKKSALIRHRASGAMHCGKGSPRKTSGRTCGDGAAKCCRGPVIACRIRGHGRKRERGRARDTTREGQRCAERPGAWDCAKSKGGDRLVDTRKQIARL